MKAVDSSVIVAAFASWHERHDVARRAMDSGVQLVEHCALETYSVLTRLPPPHRVAAELIRDFLRARLTVAPLRLSAKASRQFLMTLPERGIVGGSVYDALVAATVAEHGAELLSCDRRAASTYERFGIRFQIL